MIYKTCKPTPFLRVKTGEETNVYVTHRGNCAEHGTTKTMFCEKCGVETPLTEVEVLNVFSTYSEFTEVEKLLEAGVGATKVSVLTLKLPDMRYTCVSHTSRYVCGPPSGYTHCGECGMELQWLPTGSYEEVPILIDGDWNGAKDAQSDYVLMEAQTYLSLEFQYEVEDDAWLYAGDDYAAIHYLVKDTPQCDCCSCVYKVIVGTSEAEVLHRFTN